jgi:hypothetical protein
MSIEEEQETIKPVRTTFRYLIPISRNALIELNNSFLDYQKDNLEHLEDLIESIEDILTEANLESDADNEPK